MPEKLKNVKNILHQTLQNYIKIHKPTFILVQSIRTGKSNGMEISNLEGVTHITNQTFKSKMDAPLVNGCESCQICCLSALLSSLCLVKSVSRTSVDMLLGCFYAQNT